jgi:hypothetical protein
MPNILKMSNAGGFKTLNRYYDMLAGNTVWNPLPSGIYARFDASVSSSITSSGGLVSQWNDISGNGRHAVQASSTYQPTTGSISQNGLNTISMSAHFLLAPIFITSNAFTYFFVGSKTNAGGSANTYSRWMSLFNSAGNDYDNPSSITASYTITSQGGYSPATYAYRNNSVILAQAHTYGLANLSVARLNGTTYTQIHNGTSATGSTSATSLNTDKMNIGSSGMSLTDSALNGWIGEIILYNSVLSDSDVTIVSNYLKTKWNTA